MKTIRRTDISRREFLGQAAMVAAAMHGHGMWAEGAGGDAVVKAPCGSLRGEVANGLRTFKGVPFAEPPIGMLRFKAPVKKRAWSGVRDAVKDGPVAMQGTETNEDSEDCLYLNVYTPIQVREPLPVWVSIHGGGFTGGRPTPEVVKFAKDGVVAVTVEYRLGVFGFLDVSPLLGTGYAGSSNNAVRDLILALEWVKENIASFGGDPGRVTVGGVSAGAKLTDILLGTPCALGLFAQGISESGGAERVWATVDEAQAVSATFGEAWRKVSGKENAALLTASAAQLVDAQKKFLKAWPHRSPLKPEVDGVLLPALPVGTMAAGAAKGKRLLIGTNREESAAQIGVAPKEVPPSQIGNVTAEQYGAVEANYKRLYPEMTEERRRVRALAAEEYWVPSVRCADAMAKGGGTVWMFLMAFAEDGGKYPGFAYHGEESPMVYGTPRKGFGNAGVEASLAAKMHPAWLAYMRGEAPHGPGLPVWPAYRNETRATMVFDAETRVEMKPQEAELRLWDGLL